VSPARPCSPEGDGECLFAFLRDAALCPLSQIEQGCSGVGSTVWLDAVLERPPGALILQVATRKHNFSDLVERSCNSPHYAFTNFHLCYTYLDSPSCMHACMYVFVYVCMYVCTYVCIGLYVCMYAYIHTCQKHDCQNTTDHATVLGFR